MPFTRHYLALNLILSVPLAGQQDVVVGHEISISPSGTRLILEQANGERVVITIGEGVVTVNAEPVFEFDGGSEFAQTLSALLSSAAGGSSTDLLQALGTSVEGLDMTALIEQAFESVSSGALVTTSDGLVRPDAMDQARIRAFERLEAINLSGTNLNDAMVHSGDLTVGRGKRIDSDVVVVDGDASVFGVIAGDLVVLNGDIRLHESGRVEGDVVTVDGTVSVTDGMVRGSIRNKWIGEVPADDVDMRISPSGLSLVSVFAAFIALLGLGYGMNHFFPEPFGIVSSTISDAPGRSFLAGAFSVPLIPVVLGIGAVGLALTVVGILLIPFALIAALAALGLVAGAGYMASARAIGGAYIRRQQALGAPVYPTPFRSTLYGLTGLLAVWVPAAALDRVPLLGEVTMAFAWLVTLAALTTGLGATVLARGDLRSVIGRSRPGSLTDEYPVIASGR